MVELCRHGRFVDAIHELHADDAVAIEPAHAPIPRAEGKEAIAAKSQHFADNFEVHDAKISDALVVEGCNFFTLSMWMDVTEKTPGQRYTMSEVCVYEVKDGKIVSETFFY